MEPLLRPQSDESHDCFDWFLCQDKGVCHPWLQPQYQCGDVSNWQCNHPQCQYIHDGRKDGVSPGTAYSNNNTHIEALEGVGDHQHHQHHSSLSQNLFFHIKEDWQQHGQGNERNRHNGGQGRHKPAEGICGLDGGLPLSRSNLLADDDGRSTASTNEENPCQLGDGAANIEGRNCICSSMGKNRILQGNSQAPECLVENNWQGYSHVTPGKTRVKGQDFP